MAKIYTIGYGGRRFEDFLELLHERDISVLVDLRSNPWSHQESFRQAHLMKNLHHPIRYLDFGKELGGKPEDRSLWRNGKPDYNLIRASEQFLVGLDALKALLEQGERIALMCAERKPQECHRFHLVAQALINLRKIGVIMHIDENNLDQPQEAIRRRLTDQLSLL